MTTAFKRYHGLKATNMGWDVQKEYFTPSGAKAPSAANILTELGSMSLEASQDYNALMPILAGVLGNPVTTPIENGGTPTGAYTHVFTLAPFAADALNSYTTIFGDTTQAIRAAYTVLHSLTLGITRQNVTAGTSAILRAPETGATYPGSVTDVPMAPVRSSTWCAFLDDSWADLGTSKLLGLYDAQLSLGDKYSPDWVVDCSLDSFSELIENPDVSMTFNMTARFDATMVSEITDAMESKQRYVQLESTGPEIATTGENYALTVDACVDFTPGTVQASSTNAVAVNLDGRLVLDAITSNILRVTLVNGLATL